MKSARLFQRLATSVQRLVVAFLIFHFSFLIFAAPAFAQANPGLTANTNPDVPKNLHNWTQNVMIEVTSAMVCQLAGIDLVNPHQKCLGIDPKTGQVGFVEGGGGAIGLMGNMIAMTYTPPLHTGDYFGYLAQNFGIAKPAYAADPGRTGTGFDGLAPLLNLWIAFRNIVYMLFVAVFAVVGFGIMLRINIDPRTVMTIANQLPKMIIAILLVTFSFAISGFLIDLMWASIYVTYGVIADAKVPNTNISSLNPTNMAGKTPFDAAGGTGNAFNISFNLANATKDIIRPLIGLDKAIHIEKDENIFKNIIKTAGGILGITGNVLTSPLNWVVDGLSLYAAVSYGSKVAEMIGNFNFFGTTIPTGTFTSLASFMTVYTGMQITLREGIPFLIPFFIILTALLWALFRIWFQLIIAYVSILIDVVFAPFWIVGGLIPASPIGFGAWFRDILANLSAFPVTIGMFLLGKVFIETFTNSAGPFLPPLIGNISQTGFFGSIIGLGILFITPQVLNMMKDLFKSPQFKYGAAAGQALGVGAGLTNLPGHATTLGNTLFGLSHFPGAGRIPLIGRFIPGQKKEG